jgi:hypothetical protein
MSEYACVTNSFWSNYIKMADFLRNSYVLDKKYVFLNTGQLRDTVIGVTKG